MKRKFILGFGAIVLIVVVWQVSERLNNKVSDIIENVASSIVHTRVVLSGMSIDLEQGTADIDRLAITNPQAYSQLYILELKDIKVDFKYNPKQDNLLVIESISIMNPIISYEGHGPGGNNFKMMFNHIRNASTAENAANSGNEIGIIIDKLYVNNGQIDVGSLAAKGDITRVELAAFELSNIVRTEGGASIHEATRQVAGQLFNAIIRAASSSGVDQMIREKKRSWTDSRFRVKKQSDS